MKRISKNSALSTGAVLALIALGNACASGGEDPDSSTSGGTGNTSGGTGSTSGGTTSAAGGTTSATGGTTSATGGTAGTSTTTGGSAGTASTGPSVCDGATYALPLAEAYIDNWEADTRFESWYSFADTTTLTPIASVAGGAISTVNAGYVTASTIKSPTMMGFGAGFGFGLVDAARGKCVDITAFDGVSFWAKGTSGASGSLKFQAVIPATQPSDLGGDCTDMTKCYNHPGKSVTLSDEWQQFTVTFAELVGAVAPVTGKLLEINWISAGPDYEVWIDEVTFYKGTAPTGAIEAGAGGEGGGG